MSIVYGNLYVVNLSVMKREVKGRVANILGDRSFPALESHQSELEPHLRPVNISVVPSVIKIHSCGYNLKITAQFVQFG